MTPIEKLKFRIEETKKYCWISNREDPTQVSILNQIAIMEIMIEQMEVKNLVKPDVSGSLPSEEYELERLYDWVTSEKREPAQTKFTSGKTRDIAREIEYRLKGNDR